MLRNHINILELYKAMAGPLIRLGNVWGLRWVAPADWAILAGRFGLADLAGLSERRNRLGIPQLHGIVRNPTGFPF